MYIHIYLYNKVQCFNKYRTTLNAKINAQNIYLHKFIKKITLQKLKNWIND